jgi:hypothetical protein
LLAIESAAACERLGQRDHSTPGSISNCRDSTSALILAEPAILVRRNDLDGVRNYDTGPVLKNSSPNGCSTFDSGRI